jgi:hypothetical protein
VLLVAEGVTDRAIELPVLLVAEGVARAGSNGHFLDAT